ncbi:MAG: hypothetical protein HY650_07180 [Acidobacteria bacterium]|nr:hypothetical protein [Acidobacteriota bacterium]
MRVLLSPSAMRWCIPAIAAVMMFGATASAQSVKKTLTFTPSSGPTTGPFALTTTPAGQAVITAESAKSTLDFSFTGLRPNAVYTVWLTLDSSKAPFVAGVSPTTAMDPVTGTRAQVVGATPCAADDAGYTDGNGLDPNGFVTDATGSATFTKILNYDIFAEAVAPVVLSDRITQTVEVAGANPNPCAGSPGAAFSSNIGASYMRAFETTKSAAQPAVSPSFQVIDAPLKPRLVRGTVRGFAIVDHFDELTHGRVSGSGSANSNPCGDTMSRMSGTLANAVLNP